MQFLKLLEDIKLNFWNSSNFQKKNMLSWLKKRDSAEIFKLGYSGIINIFLTINPVA